MFALLASQFFFGNQPIDVLFFANDTFVTDLIHTIIFLYFSKDNIVSRSSGELDRVRRQANLCHLDINLIKIYSQEQSFLAKVYKLCSLCSNFLQILPEIITVNFLFTIYISIFLLILIACHVIFWQRNFAHL